jgi:hypothetical protein
MLLESIKQTLLELNDVVSQTTDEQFSSCLAIFSGSSIGMHARHVVEFYQCLLSQNVDNQMVNYDKRQRDMLLQTQTDYFIFTVSQIINRLDHLDASALDTPLSILSDIEGSAPINSSLARELHYNLEHTIHHAALIKIGLLSINSSWQIPSTFGVAPSTIRYQTQC